MSSARYIPPAFRACNVGADTKKWNDDKLKMEDHPGDTVSELKEGDEKAPMTTFRRVMDLDNEKKLSSEEIDIAPPHLQRLILKHDRTRPPRDEDDTSTLQLTSPFLNFVWYWDEYVKECTPQPEDDERIKEAREDLKDILSIVKKSSLEPYFKFRESLAASRTIKFEYLWTLFRPGTLIYSKTFMTDLQMLEVRNYSKPTSDTRSFAVICSGFDWDGSRFDAYNYTIEIEKFEGEKAIDTLKAFPTMYYRDGSGSTDDSRLRQKLIERGRKFLKLCTAQPREFQCSYRGPCQSELTGLARLTAGREDPDTDNASYSGASGYGVYEPSQSKTKTVDISGKIIVDPYTFMKSDRNEVPFFDPPLAKLDCYRVINLDCECYECKNSIVQQWNVKKQQSTKEVSEVFGEDELRLMLCPPRVLGYVLKEKVWAQFRVADVTQLDSKSESTDKSYFEKDLQLDQDHKRLLLAFVRNHQFTRSSADSAAPQRSLDVIQGKGAGLAILLHGPPGVGKTLTAETIALATNRPLMAVSVAEIGIVSENAEEKLASIFRDAQRWEAVLLVDEADVFLEARTQTDNPNRNALVSVLLRCLEYYEGIIFLTTNRINSIDIAVQSRMQLALQYKDLTTDQKLGIFRTLLSKIPDNEISKRERLEKDLRKLCSKSEVNGRQIRNIVSSARALAREDKEKLSYDYIEEVHDLTNKFMQSLKDKTLLARSKNEAIFKE